MAPCWEVHEVDRSTKQCFLGLRNVARHPVLSEPVRGYTELLVEVEAVASSLTVAISFSVNPLVCSVLPQLQ
jgi:hypothetical protein